VSGPEPSSLFTAFRYAYIDNLLSVCAALRKKSMPSEFNLLLQVMRAFELKAPRKSAMSAKTPGAPDL
jgi:hypothetical protein